MTPEMQQAIARYADRGWIDVNRSDTTSWSSRPSRPRPAYLVLVSFDMRVPPLSEAQITTRCEQPFRGTRLVIGSDATRRFDLVDLKVMFWSQFRRAEDLPLRNCVGEAAPELIQWPLDMCGVGGEICVRAIIPPREAGGEGDLGEEFEMLLLGEVGT